MRRIKLTITYDGTHFFGWQVQPALPTIQSTLEAVFSRIEGKPVHVAGSGRTDAGVHALAQVAAVSLANPIPLPNLLKAVNRLLPPDIRLMDAEEVAPGFHPRFDAVAKTYEYRICCAEVVSPFERRYCKHHPYPLNVSIMSDIAPMLKGEHDFRAFAAADDKYLTGEPLVRTIFRSALEREGNLLFYRVCGSGFLKHMVRNVIGMLLEAGKGNLGPAGVAELLRSGTTLRAGPTAPAQGLFLIRVDY